jgi:hypothetical protein
MGFSATLVGIRLSLLVGMMELLTGMTATLMRVTALMGAYVTDLIMRFSTDSKVGHGEPYESVLVQNAQDRWSPYCYGRKQCLEFKGRDDVAIASHHSTECKTIHLFVGCKAVHRSVQYSAIHRSIQSSPAFVDSGNHTSAHCGRVFSNTVAQAKIR